ncbi:MAG TPA: branched-chain amino acid ABC transporter permease [Burkholderiales bacterium]|jgi:branched-chain amino acid transport system permease protein|nr:branched-chain amino acid ABC transporter permease [Burkholderiales bacterium]
MLQRLLPFLATGLVFGTLPLWIKAVGLYPYLGVEVMIWVIYALGFNLLLGTAGLPSFGHGAYFGVGAYAFGLTQLNFSSNLAVCLGTAILAGAIAGALVGLFISHRRGIYYALLTIAFGQIFWFVAIKWHSVTRGEDGLLNIKRPAFLADLNTLYFFCFALFVVVILFLWRLQGSPFGRVLNAIKQNETRARFVGYHVWVYKWLAFTLSALVAGLAGGLFALAQQSAYPNVMSLHQSGLVVMMALIGGGLVSFWGPVLGVVLFFVARDLLGAYTETWLLWYGLLFMLVVIFKPEGLAGMLRKNVRSHAPA